jgi:hyperosmotically inducible protein
MSKVRQGLTLFTIAAFVAGTGGCSSTADLWGSGQVVDDTTLAARVKSALVKAKSVDASAIKVNSHRGEVVLTGSVDSERMIDNAELVAWKVDGVLLVTSELQVARGH